MTVKNRQPAEGPAAMGQSFFSDYVNTLGHHGEPRNPADYRAARATLEAMIAGELRRRGLWQLPPSCLGLSGVAWTDGPLEELTSDAYAFTFIERWRGLKKHLEQRGDIEPMVWRNVRNFLTEIQSKADPIGSLIYRRYRRAIEHLLNNGKLVVLGEGLRPGLSNVTTFGFELGCPCEPLARDKLGRLVRCWHDRFLPELMTANGRAVHRVIEELEGKILSLRGELQAFRFGDLLGLLKADARARWRQIWHQSIGPMGMEDGRACQRPVPMVRPVEESDWPRRLRCFESRVLTSIRTQPHPKTRDDLERLWTLLQTRRIAGGDEGPLPSQVELGHQLGLCRDRVRHLFRRLQPLVQDSLYPAGPGAES